MGRPFKIWYCDGNWFWHVLFLDGEGQIFAEEALGSARKMNGVALPDALDQGGRRG